MRNRIKKIIDEWNSISFEPYEKSLIMVGGITLPVTLLTMILQVRRTHIQEDPANIKLYIITAFVFTIVTALVSFISWRMFGKQFWKEHSSKKNRILGTGAVALLFLLVSYGLWDSYVDSGHIYPYLSYEWLFWHRVIPNKQMLPLLLLVGMAGICLAVKGKHLLVSNWFWYVFYSVVSLFAGMAGYLPNFTLNDIHHGNAYFASVYNIMQGSAYTEVCRSIYGHYAILLQYPVKLLGGSYQAFNIVMAFIGGITVFLICLVLQKYVQNPVVRIWAAGALPFAAYLLPQNRWQIYPHRFLFPALILFVSSVYFRRRSKSLTALGYVIGAFSVLWNIESGVVCILVWTCAMIIDRMADRRIRIVKDIPVFFCIRQGIYALCSLTGGYVLFEIFNLVRSGKRLGMAEFLFPLVLPAVKTQIVGKEVVDVTAGEISQAAGHVVENVTAASGTAEVNDYFMNLLSVLMPYENTYWYYAFALFGIGIMVAVVSYTFNRVSQKHLMLFTSSLMAFGQLVYFVNRPDFSNLSICYLDAVIVLALLADYRNNKLKAEYPLRIFCIAVLAVLCMFATMLGIERIYTRTKAGNYNVHEMNALMEEMEGHIPDGIAAFGSGIQEIYAQMGRDTIWHLTDMNDCTTEEHHFIFSQMQNVRECVISIRNKTTKEDYTVEAYVDACIIDGTRPFELVYQADMGEQSVWDWNVYYIRFLD